MSNSFAVLATATLTDQATAFHGLAAQPDMLSSRAITEDVKQQWHDGRVVLLEDRFAGVGDHSQRCDGLLLHVSLHTRAEQLEQPRNEKLEVWSKGIGINALTEVDDGCRRVRVYSERRSVNHQ